MGAPEFGKELAPTLLALDLIYQSDSINTN